MEQKPQTIELSSSERKNVLYLLLLRFNTLRWLLMHWWLLLITALVGYIVVKLSILVVTNHNHIIALLDLSNVLLTLLEIGSLPLIIILFIIVLAIGLVLSSQATRIERDKQTIFLANRQKDTGTKWPARIDLENPPFPSGFKLLGTFEGHTRGIFSVAWSPDGTMLASASGDGTIRLWDLHTRTLHTLSSDYTYCIAWSPDGTMLASASYDQTIRLWDAHTGKHLSTLSGHTNWTTSVAWSPDGTMLASASSDQTIRLWDAHTGKHLSTLSGHTNWTTSVAWSPDGTMLASASGDRTIRLWDAHTGKPLKTLLGHEDKIITISWSPDGTMLASASTDKTIRLWSVENKKIIRTIEGHTNEVRRVVFAPNSRFIASKSADTTVRLWHADTGQLISVLYESSNSNWTTGLAFHPTLPYLVSSGKENTIIRLWELDIDTIVKASVITHPVSYTNAKVVLVGDSGVGKSGLGLVLSGEPFALTDSTHGRRVWMFDHQEVKLNNRQKEMREILLWDLAGQPTYRIIHQLHLNEVAVALVVFDSRSETDPFAGVQYWDRAIRQAQRVLGMHWPIKKFLVAARTDRGNVSVGQERIQSIAEEMGFDGYIDTSAKEGWHVAELQEMIRQAIAWDDLPKVSSTELFQQIKAFLVEEKKSGRLLSTVDDLYSAFLKAPTAPQETTELRAQFETCIGRVEAAGLIKRLSFGKLVLLQPELLDAYASALVNTARADPDSLGSIREEQVRQCEFRISKDERIEDKEQEKLLLIAMIEDLLRRELVLREESLLIFPSQSTRENPNLPDPEGKAVVFQFEGPILNTYTTLAVRLSHSGLFKKKALWKNAITYTANRGGICGIFLNNIDEGYGELTLFFDPNEVASEETRINFEDYIALHLQRKAIPESIKRRRIFVCKECGVPMTELIVQSRRTRGFNWLDCPVCSHPLSLLDGEERLTVAISHDISEMDRAADSQRDREAAKSIIDGKQATKDFDVFLCHHNIDKAAVKEIGEKLKEQGLLPWLDEWELPPGRPWQPLLEQQIENIKAAAVFVGKNGIGPWQGHEINALLREFTDRQCPVIPVLLSDAVREPILPVFLRGMTWVDFRKKEPDPMEQLIWGITGEKKLPNSKARIG